MTARPPCRPDLEPAQRTQRCAGFSFWVRKQRGFTILEILVVVFIIAILSAVIVPQLRSTDPTRVDYAAGQVAAALTFARDLARNLEEPHGVRFYAATDSLKVFRMFGPRGNYVETFDVYHPLTKSLYEVSMGAPDDGIIPDLYNVTLDFEGTVESAVAFNQRGDPMRASASLEKVLSNGSVAIKIGNFERTVRINTAGRIWVE